MKLKLEQIERCFSKEKEQIMEMTQVTVEEIKCWIETPLTSLMGISLFLKELEHIKKKGYRILNMQSSITFGKC